MSSRNAYLDADQRRAALALSRALRAVEHAWRGGEADARVLERRGRAVLAAPGVAPEYVALVDQECRAVERAGADAVVVMAARVGPTRLIDNVVLGDGVSADPTVSG
jgi:pantoate--beta-alanine ligase